MRSISKDAAINMALSLDFIKVRFWATLDVVNSVAGKLMWPVSHFYSLPHI